MSIPKSERLQELQAALTLRQREISQLAKRKDELIEQQRANHKSSALGSTSSTTSREDPVASFVADHPVFAFCFGRENEELVWKLPIEQIGNVVAQLEAGMVALRQNQKEITKSNDAVGVRQRKAAATEISLEEKIRSLGDATGLPVSRSSTATMRYKTAPIHAMLDETMAATGKETPAQLRQVIAKARKEIHMVEIMKKKNLAVIQGFEVSLKRQDAIKEDIVRHRNTIRCLERDITEKKLTLETMLLDHDVLDRQLTIAMKPKSGDRTRAILDRDVAELKRQVEDCVEGERRVQDRVIKAQEYRILQLEKRLSSVKRALQDHKLTNRVEAAILATLVERDDERDSNGSQRSSSSLSPARGGDLPAGVDLNDKATLYNIDTIVPPQELVHPALYSLLASEKDALANVVSQQQSTLVERDQTVEVLALEVAKLTLALDEAQTLLDMTTAQIALIEDEQQDSLVEEVLEQREQYRALLENKSYLRRGLNNAHRSDVNSLRAGPSSSGRSLSGGSRSSQPQSQQRGVSPSALAPATQPTSPRATEGEASPPSAADEGAAVAGGQLLRKSNSRVRFADDTNSAAASGIAEPTRLDGTQSFSAAGEHGGEEVDDVVV